MYDGGADDTSDPLPGTINSKIISDRSANVTMPRFEPDDRDRFFGRDELVTEVRRMTTEHRFSAVFGPSGSRQLLVLADRAYQGADTTVRTPYYRHHELPEHYQKYNRNHARLEHRANAPSPASSNGGSSARPGAAPTASDAPPLPFTPSRSPGAQDEKHSVTRPADLRFLLGQRRRPFSMLRDVESRSTRERPLL
ncbi:hypothetical protein KYY02_32255 [Streptomyces pimonensis]|uniref:Novel STAND NTPase 1 domain-containing protein n=1 Tax=Streptomyces pimonensis TaxID=2860288 RepID=A0ABV4J8E8_9ACTN